MEKTKTVKPSKKTKMICTSVFGNKNFKDLYIEYVKSKIK